jgi:diguanylate cyclase (GGDEF)-like protein
MRVVVKLDAWDQTLQHLKDGEVDVVPMFVSSDRRRYVDFTIPYLHVNHLVFTRRGGAYIDSLAQLDGHDVMVERGGYAQIYLQQHVPGAKLVRVDTEPDAVRLLMHGLHEYALVPDLIGNYAIWQSKLTDIVPASPPVMPVDYAFGVSKARPDLIALLNKGIRAAQEDGSFVALRKKWLEPDSGITVADVLKRSLWWTAPLLVIAILAVAWSWALRARVDERTRALRNELRKRSQAEQEIRRLVFSDELTGLANRETFKLALQDAFQARGDKDRPLTVMVVGIRALSEINHGLGYQLGDQLLKNVAKRLQALVPQGGTVARFGAGIFGLLFNDLAIESDAMARAKQVLSIIEQPYALSEANEVAVNMHIGVALYPIHAQKPEHLLKCAELAKSVCKGLERPIVVYAQSYETHGDAIMMIADLRKAIVRGELVLYYQPKIDLITGRPCGAEALARWNHPERGFVPPDKFIPLAEDSGYITTITLWAIDKALAQRSEWARQGCDISVNVNISARDLYSDGFVEKLAELLIRHQAKPGQLVIELTETSMMRDAERSIEVFRRLKRCGIKLAVDDFGVGYSSMTYLSKLMPDEVKVDRSFVMGMSTNEYDKFIVHSTIALAHMLGSVVIAEGIEDEATLETLRTLECDLGQGYGICRPLPPEEMLNWLRSKCHDTKVNA